MRTVPITVLVSEGPLARAYLARMRRAGLRPQRVVLMIQSAHPATGRRMGRWLPGTLARWYARQVQDQAQNYWPRRIRLTHPGLVQAISTGMAVICDGAAELIEEMLGSWDWRRYAQCVDYVLVSGLGDPRLIEALSSLGETAVLYTGGGIVPERLLRIAGLRFLHVHPGHLPHVRGADGLLWSVLIRGRPGASAFWMNGGIDTGDVILAVDWPVPRFDLSELARPDDQTLYRAIFSYCDPLLRAATLVDKVLVSGSNPLDLPVWRQDLSAGVTYHFMHPALRGKVLERVFVGHGCQR